jgi:flavodoxin
MIERKNILVAYFSWSGNTREIADQIHHLVGGDIFEIKPSRDYPVNYNSVLDMAKQEIRSGIKPELKDKPASIEAYSNIFIGYPNWWNTFPAPVATFLSEYDFTGKTIFPFCTHGGGGFGHSVSDIRKQCPSTEVSDGFSVTGYRAGNANSEVEKWLNKVLKTSIS